MDHASRTVGKIPFDTDIGSFLAVRIDRWYRDCYRASLRKVGRLYAIRHLESWPFSEFEREGTLVRSTSSLCPQRTRHAPCLHSFCFRRLVPKWVTPL